MQRFFNLDGIAPGESVRLLVSGTSPDEKAGRWTKQTPVIATRAAPGWSFATPVELFTTGESSGHRALCDLLKSHGAQLFEAVRESDMVRRAYRAKRRAQISRAVESRTATTTGTRAQNALELARLAVQTGAVPFYVPDSIWHSDYSAGAPFKAYGESMRWIEKPESCGLRFVGAAHDIARRNGSRAIDHNGWYLDEFSGYTVSGVVYQLPARNGIARFLAGYSDPHGKPGSGAACLSMEIFDDSMEAAYRSDGIAESMAESERDYQAAFDAGCQAREKAREAREIGTRWTRARKAIRTAFRERREAVRDNVPMIQTRAWIRAEISRARELCESYREAVEAAREARDESRPSRNSALLDGWREGYGVGQ